MKKTRTNIYLDSEIKKQVEELARKENRSFANWVETVIEKEIEKRRGQK